MIPETQMRATPTATTSTGTPWSGWLAFAAILLAVVGSVNIVQGLAALLDEGYFVARTNNQLLIADFATWGWVLLIWGTLQLASGLGVGVGQGWARYTAIAVVSVSVLIQIAFLAAYPIWSTIIIALDVIVLYALTARWSEARAGL